MEAQVRIRKRTRREPVEQEAEEERGEMLSSSASSFGTNLQMPLDDMHVETVEVDDLSILDDLVGTQTLAVEFEV